MSTPLSLPSLSGAKNENYHEVLVDVVKLAQKLGLKGAKGGWKDFLNHHDKKFGDGLSDPAKRSMDVLVAFMETFTEEKDCLFFSRMIRRNSDYKAVERFIKKYPDRESPEQRLVRLTMEHSQYAQHYSFPSHDKEWMIVPLGKVSKAMKSRAMISIDCEMVLCEDGTEAIVKVCAVDHNLEVKLDRLVNPNKAIADYRTGITGITANDLEGVTCSLVDIQESLKELLSHGTILIGHSLHNDLQALKIDHARVIDTAYIFKYIDFPASLTPSLNKLCKSVLGFEVRKEGEAHNCLNDAEAAMKLALAKLEHGLDDPIAIEGKNVSDSDLTKLFLHKIPVEVPCQELRSLFCADYDIDIQTDVRIRGQCYSTFAVFKDAREADAAFREVQGQEDKDSWGRLQKNASLELSTGQTISLYIRKMTTGDQLNSGELSKRRLAQGEEDQDAKRQRMCLQPCDQLNEIENLKQELRKMDENSKQELRKMDENFKKELKKMDEKFKKELRKKDEEIFSMQKIVAAVTRKHGL